METFVGPFFVVPRSHAHVVSVYLLFLVALAHDIVFPGRQSSVGLAVPMQVTSIPGAVGDLEEAAHVAECVVQAAFAVDAESGLARVLLAGVRFESSLLKRVKQCHFEQV